MTSFIPPQLHRRENWRYTDLKSLDRPDWQAFSANLGEEKRLAPCPFISEDSPHRLSITNMAIEEAGQKITHHSAGGLQFEVAKESASAQESYPLASPFNRFFNNHWTVSSAPKTAGAQPLWLDFTFIQDQIAKSHAAENAAKDSTSESAAKAGACCIDLNIGAESQLTVFESWGSDQAFTGEGAGDFWGLPWLRIHLEKGASVRWLRLGQLDKNISLTSRMMVQLEENSRFDWYNFGSDHGSTRQEMVFDFNGPGANAHLYSAYRADGSAICDYDILMRHLVGQTYSRQTFHAIASDKGQASFQSKIYIAEGANDTDAGQSHKALLLSDEAMVNAYPSLEIYTDRVKCAHGATTGELDPMQIFYLRTRGISDEVARALLMEGFLAEVLQEAPELLPLACSTPDLSL